MRKYGEIKRTRILMATVPHVISGLGPRKFKADGFLLTRVYIACVFLMENASVYLIVGTELCIADALLPLRIVPTMRRIHLRRF